MTPANNRQERVRLRRPLSLSVPPSATLRGECGAERWCLVLPSATLRGEPGTGDGCPFGAPLSAALCGNKDLEEGSPAVKSLNNMIYKPVGQCIDWGDTH